MMAKGIHRLTTRTVAAIKKPGFHADGGGLYLQVTPSGGRSWVYRFQRYGKARWMGLGSIDVISLKDARQKALDARLLLDEGKDPIDDRRAARQAYITSPTFRKAAQEYIEERDWGSGKDHAAIWARSLEIHVYPVFGDVKVADVDDLLVLKALRPMWTAKYVTAKRLRQRIEIVLDWATASDYREGKNPARWEGRLKVKLPSQDKNRLPRHHPALDHKDIAAFLAVLQHRPGVSARALEFLVLTAARTGEALGATWNEIDLDARVWTVPSRRMKGGREHRVPLSDPAMDILRAMKDDHGQEGYVFPGKSNGGSDPKLAVLALNSLKRRMGRNDLTVHGFRSTFRDWAAERTNFPREVCEMALAHTVGNSVETAYRRTDLLGKRERLMNEWGRYCYQPALSGEVVSIRPSA